MAPLQWNRSEYFEFLKSNQGNYSAKHELLFHIYIFCFDSP